MSVVSNGSCCFVLVCSPSKLQSVTNSDREEARGSKLRTDEPVESKFKLTAGELPIVLPQFNKGKPTGGCQHACNRLHLQTLGSQPMVMPKNLPDHWSPTRSEGRRQLDHSSPADPLACYPYTSLPQIMLAFSIALLS